MFQQLTVKSARVKTTGLNCKNGWSIFLWTDKVKLMMHLPFSVYITKEILTKSLFFSMCHTFLVDFLSQSWRIVSMASPILARSHRNWCSEFELVFSSLRVWEQEARPFFASTTLNSNLQGSTFGSTLIPSTIYIKSRLSSSKKTISELQSFIG